MSLRRALPLLAGLLVVGTIAFAAVVTLREGARRRAKAHATAAPVSTPIVAAGPRRHRPRRGALQEPVPGITLTAQPASEPADVRHTEPPAAPPVMHRAWPARTRSAPPVTLSGGVTPHSVEVITVGVPEEIPAADTVPWRVLPTPRAELLSTREGTLLPAASDTQRKVVVVARIPAMAPAGPTHVATAEFDGGDATIAVDVGLLVTRVRRADVRLIRSGLAVRPTDRAEFKALVSNRGNAVDTLSIDATLPDGWELAAPPRRLVLTPGQQQVVRLTALVPRDAQPTHTYVVVTARADGTALADATADVDVLDRRDRDGRGGPVLTTAVASSFGDSVVSAPVVALDLQGNYSDHTTLLGRAAFATDRAHTNIQAIGRVGVYLGQAYLTVTNPNWGATVGGTGRQFSTTTGLNAYGVGASGTVAGDGWSASGMAAAPTGGASGQLFGGQIGRRIGGGTLTATATNFKEQGVFSRDLQAAGLDYTSPLLFGGRLTGGLAWRSFTGGDGMGWSLGANRSTATDYLTFAASHTPGGSRAYAQATDQLVVSGMRRLSDRVAIHAGYGHTSDRSATFNALTDEAANAGTDLRLSEENTLTLDLSTDHFSAQSTGLGFGSREVTARAALNGQVKKFSTQVALTAGQVQRSTTLGAFAVDGPAATRLGAAASAGWTSSRGRFMATASYDYSGPGAGFYPNALQLGVMANGIVLSRDPKVPTLDASIQRFEWFGARSGATIVRVGSAVQLGEAYRLVVDVERNPFLQADQAGATPIVAAVKIERGIGLPITHRSASARGVVYEDLNGNGIRDRSEPALAGVTIRRGGEVTSTDEKGRFDLYQEDSRPAAIDATSLPLGMVPGAVTQTSRELELAVMPTAAVVVDLAPVADELGRTPTTKDLSPAVIVATDSTGIVWTIQADSTGHARLDALPPGRYTITADFSAIEERLRIIGSAPVVEVRAGTAIPPIRLPFGLRTVKMFNLRSTPLPLAKEPK